MRYEIVNEAGEIVYAARTIVEARIWLNKYRAPGDMMWDTLTGYVVAVIW